VVIVWTLYDEFNNKAVTIDSPSTTKIVNM